MAATTGVVRVDHHQFYLSERDVDPTDAAARGTLIEVGAGFVSFYTGIAFGPVEYAISVTDGPPELDFENWEVIEESEVVASTPLYVMGVDGHAAASDGIPAGRYRIRASASGRDSQYGMDVPEPTERYLIQMWPTTTHEAEVNLICKTDQAWASATQVNESNLSFDHVYVRSEGGEIKKVLPQSPEAQAVFAEINGYGGRPLTPVLERIFASRSVAALDRPLIDRLESANPDDQMWFARWCIRKSWERAGFAHIDWFQQVLSEMDSGGPPNPDLINSSAARNRLDADARITRVVAPGLPGSAEVIPQYQALLGYTRSMAPGIGPLEAAIEAFHSAALTYGMEYPQLLEEANSAVRIRM